MKYLIVDDEKVIRDFLERFLIRLGHDVLLAANAQLGYELALHEQPEVIITDYDLGDGNGVAMLQRLKAALPARPLPRIIMMSGINPDFFKKLADEDSLDLLKLFLPKPFTINQLSQLTNLDATPTNGMPKA